LRPSEKTIIASLRSSGHRLTPQRRVVVHAIASSPDHLTPAEIFQKVSRTHPSIGLVTVYRTLEVLAEQGLVCELHAGGACPSYTLGSPQTHHHLICSICGKVVDFAADDLQELENRLSRESGFAIDRRLLEMVGRCRTCRAQQRAS
jgi:Fur family ferric uptake transcriptional regulator